MLLDGWKGIELVKTVLVGSYVVDGDLTGKIGIACVKNFHGGGVTSIISLVAAKSTRSSADADNRLDAFSGQSRSANMVPFHM